MRRGIKGIQMLLGYCNQGILYFRQVIPSFYEIFSWLIFELLPCRADDDGN